MDDKIELKPCPFCGGKAGITKHFKEDMWSLLHRCPVIGPILIDWTVPRSNLVTQWNTRKQQSQTGEE
jgi:hypothetical protein